MAAPTREENPCQLGPVYTWVLLGLCNLFACYQGVRSTGQCNAACSLSAGVWKPKVFRGR